MKTVRKLIHLVRITSTGWNPFFSPSLAAIHNTKDSGKAAARVIQELNDTHGYVGSCFTSACSELQSHFHGPECHFTCICEKGQNCHDSRE